MDPQVQAWLKQAAEESSVFQRKLWIEETQNSLEFAKEQGVTIYDVDQSVFARNVQPMYDAITDDAMKNLIARIREVQP